MKPFHTIAIPHDDILGGRLTMDVFAADLWEVYKGRSAEEYQDPTQFFQKTYVTAGLTNLLDVVHKRLQGSGGDPVLQLQTPFGGGKTHALIALYHKAAEWDVRPVVFVGTPLAAGDAPWIMLEQQLTGERREITEWAAPGREALRDLLLAHQPVLILMDELPEYMTKAAAVRVGDSTLAAQTVAFVQELTEAVANLPRAALLITFPTGRLERQEERAEELILTLQHVAGRLEKIYTPVQEHEIASVIRRRLFSHVDTVAVQSVVAEFMGYAGREGLLPPGVEPSEYRRRFEAAYPFLPEVVDVLYQRWGSFYTFQRARGTLRLLGLVVHALKDRPIPYITLADFDLANQEIRRELLKHIGQEFDSVIAADITGNDAGARKANLALGKAYQGLQLGTRAATTIFLYSFSGGIEKGAAMGEIQRHATTLGNPASAIVEAVEQLTARLFFLDQHAGKVLFTNEPNLNRILLMRMENVAQSDIHEHERELLRERIVGRRLKVYIWPKDSGDIPDNADFKLIILPATDEKQMRALMEQKGASPRVHRNTLFFLSPLPSERATFENLVRRLRAYQSLHGDKGLKLSAERREEVERNIATLEGKKGKPGDVADHLRRLYQRLYIPAREGLKDYSLGIPTQGDTTPLDEEVYEKLRSEGEILQTLAPLVIKEKYLHNRDYVLTEQLYQVGLKTPGETRVISQAAWEAGIAEGVRKGMFGLGELDGDRPVCRYFNEEPSLSFADREILIRAYVCQEQRAAQADEATYASGEPTREGTAREQPRPLTSSSQQYQSTLDLPGVIGRARTRLRLKFLIPKGKVAGLMGVMNFLQSRFNRMEVILHVEDGQLTDQEYEDKIKEAFRQMGIEVEEE